jgi:DNA-binding SARP family transcriptional activator/DNA-binding beta-propeller fold protein YncE
VLALLLLYANEVVSTDRLIDEVWGDSPPESAVNMLQGYVSHLRKTLEPESRRGEHALLLSQPPGYVLRIRPDQVDAGRFERLAVEGRQLLDEGDPEAAADRLRAALALWRGGALDDLAYERFARAEIERLEERRLEALEDRLDADLALGRHTMLVGELRELVAQHPLRERLRAQLMTALYRSGRQADALDVYREGRRALHDQLGIEPGPALRELEQAILRQDPALGGTPAAPSLVVSRTRRRWPLIAAITALVVAGAVSAAIATLEHSSAVKLVAVKPHSVAVIDPKRNAVVSDIPTGGYPGPLAADDIYVYVCNIGDATVSRIAANTRTLIDTSSFSRAIDMIAGNGELWSANGGAPGHTPFKVGPGTVSVSRPGPTVQTIRVGPSTNGDEEQTTIAADSPASYSVWVGNKDSRTVRQLDRALGKTLITILGIAPGGLAAVGDSGAGDTVCASDPAHNLVARIDEHARGIVRRIPIENEPTRLAADNDAVWVIARDRNGPGEWRPTRETTPALWRIDAKTNKAIARIPLPLTPIRVALGAGSVWVSAERVLSEHGTTVDATVFRIDPKTNRIVARIPLRTGAVDGIIVSHGLVWAAIPASQ